jgi:tRNA(Ile)-lysidine synthase
VSGRTGAPEERPLEVADESGLVPAGEPLLVLLSGGADSVCLLDVAVELGAEVSALHVNHGLRPDAASDEARCRELCDRLGVPLAVERVEIEAAEGAGRGNVQAEARDARYALAERHARADYAAAHTATDQAETVVYRLAVSPGRRALLGMQPRRGRLVRPLLEATRAETRARCRARGLAFVEDPSNADPRFARARVRADVMPVLRDLNPEAERGIAETSRLLRDEAEVLARAVDDALERTGAPAARLAELRDLPAGLARLVLRRLAERAAAGPHPLSRRDADAILALGDRGGSASLDLGGGLRAVAEYGTLRFTATRDLPPPEPVRLPVPGTTRFGEWEVSARIGTAGEALLHVDRLGPLVTVRSWRDGDRMRPAGLGGSKSLQDLFTDHKVPREMRRSLPVVVVGDEIAWVAGVAVGERFRAGDGASSAETVGVSARHGA